MAILYVADQGAFLMRRGNRLVVEKARKVIHWVHAFKVDQVVLMGNISISPGAISYLLQEGIDTVFMSIYGKYRGRLISQFGKNIELRRAQFTKMDDEPMKLSLAKEYIKGKLHNCRILLRRYNREFQKPELTSAAHRIRLMARKVSDADSIEGIIGLEGQSAATYFGCFGSLIKEKDIVFNGRNRRPPRDPINVLLSLGYTLLANAIQTQVHVVGLDPYIGCLHSVEYGRPSLVLDLMEEFRPVLVDSLVLTVINKKIIRHTDFYRPEEQEPAAFDFAEETSERKEFPILLTHNGMKKFITHFEGRLNQKVFYMQNGRRLSYRGVCLEQVRLLVRHLNGEDEYMPYLTR
jgi:CRISP-associated protein Cas1